MAATEKCWCLSVNNRITGGVQNSPGLRSRSEADQWAFFINVYLTDCAVKIKEIDLEKLILEK